MFGDALTRMTRVNDGQATLNMPFPSDSVPWPLIFPRLDYGKWVMGAFEAGEAANGVYVNAISEWYVDSFNTERHMLTIAPGPRRKML